MTVAEFCRVAGQMLGVDAIIICRYWDQPAKVEAVAIKYRLGNPEEKPGHPREHQPAANPTSRHPPTARGPGNPTSGVILAPWKSIRMARLKFGRITFFGFHH